MRTRTLIAGLVATLATVGFAFAGGGKDTKSLEGKKAPAFSLPTVDGKTVNLEELKGKVVVLDFWATWCGPCRQAMPHLQELASNTELADKGLKVFAINLRESADKIQPFIEKSKYTFTVPMDKDGKIAQEYLVQGIPTQVVIGRDGTIKNVFVGFDPEEGGKNLHAAIEAALKAPTAMAPGATPSKG